MDPSTRTDQSITTVLASTVRQDDLLIEGPSRVRVMADPGRQGSLVHFPVQVWRADSMTLGFWSLPAAQQVQVIRHEDAVASQARGDVDRSCPVSSVSAQPWNKDPLHARQGRALQSMSRVHGLVRAPLTPPSYEQHRRDEETSAEAIGLLFGSWNAACVAANIVPGRSARSLVSRYSDEDLYVLVRQYLDQTSTPGASGFERWLLSRGRRAPMLSVVSARLGTWTQVVQQVMHH